MRSVLPGAAAAAFLFVTAVPGPGPAAEPAPDYSAVAAAYPEKALPVLKRFCAECHSGDQLEAEIDLGAFESFDQVRRRPEVWRKVGEMLASGQMPPEDAEQPPGPERDALRGWVQAFLKEEAKRTAGDPGPVVLRRLSNAEYTYAIRDLTGVDSLEPAREFPVDGAAGEGFTNAGQGLVMSPALLAKYLDAGKEVAAHAILLPDGIRFSPHTTRRDWTDDVLTEIRALYGRYTAAQGASSVNLQGIVFETNGGGRLPVEEYLAALLAARSDLVKRATSVEAVARGRGLSPKYAKSLWEVLEAKTALERGADPRGSLLLDGLRAEWRKAKPEDAARLAAEVAKWQQALWRFTSVGHIGKVGGPKAWMEQVDPITDRQEIRFPIPAATDPEEVMTLYLVAGDAGDGSDGDYVVWERPRFVVAGRPDLLLRDARPVLGTLAARRERVLANTARCLAAAAEGAASTQEVDTASLAQKHGVEPDDLAAWLDYLGIGRGGPTLIESPLTHQSKNVSGYDFVTGWVGSDALSIVANSSDQAVRIPGNMKPHGVAVHPTPTRAVAVGWRCPEPVTLKISGQVQHAHPECGNGVTWTVELRSGNTRRRLAQGIAHGGAVQSIGPIENIGARTGDLVSLIIGPRDGNHSCDLTAIDLTLAGGERQWDLARELSGDILAGNPHADGHGNGEVWHFYSEPVSGPTGPVIPPGSLLARWQAETAAEERARLAEQVQELLVGDGKDLPPDSPDGQLRHQLVSLGGPLFATALAKPPVDSVAKVREQKLGDFGLDPTLFGRHPDGTAIEAANLCVKAPAVVEVRLPADLIGGAHFVATGTLHSPSGDDGSAQFQVTTTRPAEASGLKVSGKTETVVSGPWTSNNLRLEHTTPVVVKSEGKARDAVLASFAEFRQWFPAALGYTKIVPVDEVVTLTLFHREDEPLVRLMLGEEEAGRLEELWRELHFVSQDAFALVDAYEQLLQFATQDADPKVFEPMGKVIRARAESFKKELEDAEPAQLRAVKEWAARAYRRPLTESEARELGDLYAQLRREEMGHEAALRLLIARVLVSPAFLYRAEPSGGAEPNAEGSEAERPYVAGPVTDTELATRLSFFLWSSIPDGELREIAARGELAKPDVLSAQARRLLADPKVRRLATEFGCQWLDIYDFAAHDEKSPEAFPTFSALRGDMYEETIRFLADWFQRDGSVLELLDSDHTFLNEALAKHYAIEEVTGPGWRRVDGVKGRGRGGVLGMATTLAKQSGASRTSPILRGNWVSETLLGEKLPKPPKNVPQLPETVPAGLTERELIERHSSVASCAKCHARIDPFGFALEEFDAIGRWRSTEANTRAKVLDGTEIEGRRGLAAYLLGPRRDDFVRQFSKKLLGYALGRGVLLSDEPLLDEIQTRLRANDYRVGVAIETIIQSPQFRMIRLGDKPPSVSGGPLDLSPGPDPGPIPSGLVARRAGSDAERNAR